MSRLVEGPIGWAKVLRTRPRWLPPISGTTAATRLGITYERKAHEEMTKRYGAMYQHGVWFHYADTKGEHFCQVDGLLDCGSHYVVLEMKYNHVEKAWQQLRYLYQPVVRAWSRRPVHLVEVVKWLDPNDVTGRIRLIKDLEKAKPNKFYVHVWRPKLEIRETPTLDQLWTTNAF